MASMKAALDSAAELLGIPVELLTSYVLDRDPDNRARHERQGRALHAARQLGLSPTELLLAALDIERTTAMPERNTLRAIREAVKMDDDRASTARLLDVCVVLDKAGY